MRIGRDCIAQHLLSAMRWKANAMPLTIESQRNDGRSNSIASGTLIEAYRVDSLDPSGFVPVE